MSETMLDEVLAYVRQDRRICPLPPYWNQLWEMLPNRRRKGVTWEPSPPLILAAWHFTTDAEKQSRLEQHIRWAAEHGSLKDVWAFLQNLHNDQWERTH